MPDDAVSLEALHVVPEAAVQDLVKVLRVVHAVDETEVRIIHLEGAEIPGDLLLDLVKVAGPAVLVGFVDRAEVHLSEDLVTPPGEGLGVGEQGCFDGWGKVKVVDTVLDGGVQHGNHLVLRARKTPGAETDDAYFLASVGQRAIFHMYLRKKSISGGQTQASFHTSLASRNTAHALGQPT